MRVHDELIEEGDETPFSNHASEMLRRGADEAMELGHERTKGGIA
jgi:hypothetical protein